MLFTQFFLIMKQMARTIIMKETEGFAHNSNFEITFFMCFILKFESLQRKQKEKLGNNSIHHCNKKNKILRNKST